MIIVFNKEKSEFLYMSTEFTVGPPYWVRDWLVYGRNPADAKSEKKT